MFGMVAACDILDGDRKRNIAFAWARSSCQTITQEVSDLYTFQAYRFSMEHHYVFT